MLILFPYLLFLTHGGVRNSQPRLGEPLLPWGRPCRGPVSSKLLAFLTPGKALGEEKGGLGIPGSSLLCHCLWHDAAEAPLPELLHPRAAG